MQSLITRLRGEFEIVHGNRKKQVKLEEEDETDEEDVYDESDDEGDYDNDGDGEKDEEEDEEEGQEEQDCGRVSILSASPAALDLSSPRPYPSSR
ncbi:hypothetical protein IWW34DRAFT_855723 [Fusarium oxysporum f. sp. albedinis]|nr:hypothetical protein IWW34DRAFT_855723 [Fusarium oxysporum f. sp. albedinis]